MALDIALHLENSDVQLVNSDQWRIYNMIKNSRDFKDNNAIGLDIGQMLSDGLSENAIKSYIFDWLNAFEIDQQFISFRLEKGQLKMEYKGGEYVFS